MSIDERIYETLKDNNNIIDKTWFNNNLQFAKAIYNTYDVDYTFDNVIDIIKNIKIVDGNEEEKIHYDNTTNTLVLGKSNTDVQFNLCKSFLHITSQRFNEETNEYNSGIIYKDEDGNEYGTKVNDLLMSELITINTGLEEERYDEELTPINSMDMIIKDLLSTVNYNEFISYFANAEGSKLFNMISSVIGEDNSKQFYKSIDDYESNSMHNQMIYNICMNALVNSSINKNNTSIKM